MSIENENTEGLPSASNLLSQWREHIDDRSKELEDRRNDFMMPPIGIEEAVSRLVEDNSDIMWFVDKLLKKIAELEARLNEKPKPNE